MGTITLYIIHGWGYAVDMWQPFISALKDEGIEGKLLHVPGLTTQTDRSFTLTEYVTWLSDELPKNKPVYLLGHSNGGRIALAFSRKYPERVARLILMDSAGIYHNELSLRIKRALFKTIATVGKKVTKSEKLRRLLYKLTREGDYKNASLPQRETMRNMLESDKHVRWENSTIPTTIIWGRNDKVTPLQNAQILHRYFSNSAIHVIDGARHSPQFTHPKEVKDIITECLQSSEDDE